MSVGGRGGPVVVDLTDSSTFSAFSAFDVIIGCHDTEGVSGVEAAGWCIAHGKAWLDVSADRPSVERLLALAVEGRGHAIVGVGLFPGLSTALAAEAAAAAAASFAGHYPQLDLGIRLGVFSGAGRGVCSLMVGLLTRPSIFYIAGRRVEGPALGGGLHLAYLGGKSHSGRRVGLPDAELIHRATGTDARVYLAVRPGIVTPAFSLVGTLVRIAGPLRPAVIRLLRASLVLLRARLLRDRPAPVQITAKVIRETRRLACPDGQRATGAAIAAAVACWQAGYRPSAGGVHLAVEAFPPDALLAHAQRLCPEIVLDSGG
ncbi:MAG: hypothetical protein R3F60_29495 [bacterium]